MTTVGYTPLSLHPELLFYGWSGLGIDGLMINRTAAAHHASEPVRRPGSRRSGLPDSENHASIDRGAVLR